VSSNLVTKSEAV